MLISLMVNLSDNLINITVLFIAYYPVFIVLTTKFITWEDMEMKVIP